MLKEWKNKYPFSVQTGLSLLLEQQEPDETLQPQFRLSLRRHLKRQLPSTGAHIRLLRK